MSCPLLIAWIAATGIVLGYEIELDGVIVQQTQQNQGEVCIEDEGSHIIRVVSIMVDGSRVASDPLTGSAAQMAITAQVPRDPVVVVEVPRPPDAVCADFDGDRVVDTSDFGAFARAWGTRNDGASEVPAE